MIQIIAGKKGKGKTKHLLDKVNAEVKEVHGNIVYLDKSSKHMYELNNKVRLIDTSEFGLSSSDGSDLSVALFHRITIWSRCIWTAF